MRKLIACLLIPFLFVACARNERKADPKLLTDTNLLHNNIKQITEVIVHDVFSPPVASRIYAYTNLASYEAIRFARPGYVSIAAQLNGVEKLPEPEKNKKYNYLLAATKAAFTVAEKITFSADTLANYQNNVYEDFKSLLDKDTYNRSIAFGEEIGKKILKRTTIDNYKETRAMEKFLGSDEPGKWRPTPPDYADGAEPYWAMIKPLKLDSATQFQCAPPYPYSVDSSSNFFKQAKEVYNIGRNLSDSEKTIARYWDDNPFVTEHSGHLMYGNKKITPVGHWMGITGIACKMKNLNEVETAQTYLLTSLAIFDGFISCWKVKYDTQVVRPVTVVNELIDRTWQPFLQTPPFPEHVSAHSVISAAAATILSKRFGENFPFHDTSEMEYIGMQRNFSSFMNASLEASVSRVYGGIHYMHSVNEGVVFGKKIGDYYNNNFNLKNKL
ncbi:vanadium-dependent haloperoxidase [Segetibacter koreensis]|uniref:vanadium-dependent haloperoxidase n=1 Tax=Segetibacter koreensis TaxID=398037 RepID=UPI000362A06B|nr:vanadium-dependent haloperoxidase [Segetibacter koreensis]